MAYFIATITRDLGNVLPLALAITSPFTLSFLTVYLDCCWGGISPNTNCLGIAGLGATSLGAIGFGGIFFGGINGILACGKGSLLIFSSSLTSFFLLSLNFLRDF